MLKNVFVVLLLILITASTAPMDKSLPKLNTLAFVSDTQAPMWIEGVFLRKDNNPEATRMIMQNILSQNPATLFMLGDVVSLGPSKRAWITIDYFLKEFKKEKIPYYAILGNH